MAGTPRTASQADFTFKVADLEAELRVIRFRGDEGLSQLFEFRIEFAADAAGIDVAAVLGKACLLEIAGASGSRFVHGMIRRIERVGQGVRSTYYSVEVVPVHWLLTKRQRCRIFQQSNCSDMTVRGIVTKVFQDAGVPTDAYRFALSAEYAAREYVVQYRESEFDFVSRLMEEEGIFYFFEHTPQGHKMVIADSGVAHVVSELDAECVYRDPSGLLAEKEYLHTLRDAAEIQAGAARLKDFDFVKPATNLGSAATADAYASLELSDYPGGYLERDVGGRLAQVRLEEQQCRRRVLHLRGNVRGLMPGYKFTLAHHPDSAFNREYLVTHVAQRAAQPQTVAGEGYGGSGASYEVDLRVIPSDVPYRPPRLTPRPFVRGSQTALVVGPSGEEIYTDQYGRVKVQFHWDLEGGYDENSSCWIRVSQGMAGGQYGMMFLPRVGQEVVVDFLEGDPDRPIIVGRVYNNDQMPPYTLPDNKTRSCIKTHSSTGGGGTNEIMFEDVKDGEKILIFAQKDYHLRVTNDRVENVDHNHYLTVKEHAFELVKKKKHSEVTLDLNEKIGGKHSHDVGGDLGQKVGGNHSLESSGNIYLKAGQSLVLEGGTGLTLKVGGNFVTIDSSGVSIQGTLTKINSGGAALSAAAVALDAPEATIEADTATPGQDVTYQPQVETLAALEPPEGQFEAAQVEAAEPPPTSWVEIEMVDEDGQPWAGELYEITRADGRVIRGKLNEKGQAHIGLPAAEDATLCFPNLDADAWERRT